MIIVVGIGADGMTGLSEHSRSELRRATVIYGSKRQLALLDDTVTAERWEWPTPMLPAVQGLSPDMGLTYTWLPAATRCCMVSAPP